MTKSRTNHQGQTNKAKQAIARDMLERYTGSPIKAFRKQIILTNFDHYLQRFKMRGERGSDLIRPSELGVRGRQRQSPRFTGTRFFSGSVMQVCHSADLDVSLVDFSIGSPTAALIMELLAGVEPKAVLFLGMCGGLHRSLKLGDFILPIAAIRDEGASRHFMPSQVPALPTFKVQKFISQILVEKGLDYRTGVVHTTDYRFWEFDERFKYQLYSERAIAIDMECAALFVSGFASRVAIGALLLVSDLPLKKKGIKTKKSASKVFRRFTDIHLEIGMKAMSEIAGRGEHIRHYRW